MPLRPVDRDHRLLCGGLRHPGEVFSRTIRDAAFRASHEPLGGKRWRRTGTYRAWQVSDERVLRTLEGRAVAQPGDWVVEGRGGERWPVSDDRFRRTCRAVAGE